MINVLIVLFVAFLMIVAYGGAKEAVERSTNTFRTAAYSFLTLLLVSVALSVLPRSEAGLRLEAPNLRFIRDVFVLFSIPVAVGVFHGHRIRQRRMGPGALKGFPPYDEQQWQADMKLRAAGEFHALVCPDCNFSGDPFWYGPRDDEQGRHYRACKKCGFWQEADGTPAYRCWLTMHLCEQLHPTAWILTPKEDGYLCQLCKTWIGREHSVPWPEAFRR